MGFIEMRAWYLQEQIQRACYIFFHVNNAHDEHDACIGTAVHHSACFHLLQQRTQMHLIKEHPSTGCLTSLNQSEILNADKSFTKHNVNI